MTKDLVSFASLSAQDLVSLFSLTRWLKDHRGNQRFQPMAGKTGALIFEKQSLRTRVSFEVGLTELGAQHTFLTQDQIGLKSREAIRDIAEVLSRYCHVLVARTLRHETVEQLAEYSSVPVINALTDLLHPCQILADAFTLIERDLLTPQTKIVFVGDGNNVANSWIELAEKLPLNFTVACPAGYEPDQTLLSRARAAGLSTINVTTDVIAAASNADVLYTDVWTSMGQEAEAQQRKKDFAAYQINSNLLSIASPECVVMHCLPAHRGEEITAEVLEGPQSVVIDEAENRLHAQKALLTLLCGNPAALPEVSEVGSKLIMEQV